MTVLPVVLLLLGDVITTTGGAPRFTVIDAETDPSALVHVTVIVLGPVTSVTELVLADTDAAPLTVQVVPAGIVVEPAMV